MSGAWGSGKTLASRLSEAKKEAPFEGKVAVVTGGTRGIGRAIVTRLASLGVCVVFTYHNEADKATELLDTIKKEGGKGAAVQMSLDSMNKIRHIFAEATEQFGGVDIFVNNAGTVDSLPLEKVLEAQFDKTVQTNFKGPFFALQEASRVLRKGGRIINISASSTKSDALDADFALFEATKAALDRVVSHLAKTLGARGITVNSISPGVISTGNAKQLDKNHNVVKATPLGRLGDANDVAGAVEYLISDNAAFITGTNINVSGGLVVTV